MRISVRLGGLAILGVSLYFIFDSVKNWRGAVSFIAVAVTAAVVIGVGLAISKRRERARCARNSPEVEGAAVEPE
jgi:hypothetical protein